MFSVLLQISIGDDIVEFCGGESRVSTICIRRWLKSGGNFDIVTQCDLNDPAVQKRAMDYLDKFKPLVAVMAPTCRPFGPRAHMNRVINHDGWRRSYEDAAPHGRFCGRVADKQMNEGRFFINEQPHPSSLYEEDDWKRVVKRPEIVTAVIHQCMTGQRGPTGKLLKKPTGFVANHPILLWYLLCFVCDHSHEHEPMIGSSVTGPAQIWTWILAKAVADGIVALKQFLQRHTVAAFPSIGVGGEDDGVADDAVSGSSQSWRNCPGCRGRMNKTDASHNRVDGVCKHPFVEPVVHECRGCQKRLPEASLTHSHIPGECKFSSSFGRRFAPRTGKHPRAPRVPAHGIPGSDAQAQLPDGSDLGSELVNPSDQVQPQESSPAQESSPERAVRGPDTVDRVRRTFREASVGAPQPNDWSRFDIASSLRNLKSTNPSVVLKELRKLHLRWWHAGSTGMSKILAASGIGHQVLGKIQDVVRNCKECRAWALPGNITIPSLSLPERFGQYVEVDLLFYKTYIVFHMIDRCTRWHAGKPIPGKDEQTLLNAVFETWIAVFGPPENLISDGESGLTSQAGKDHLKRQGVNLRVRAPEQHARFAERYGAILRVCMHVTEEQCQREGIPITIEMLVAQCLFVGNSLTTVGTQTPYNAVLGRQPGFLPPLADVSSAESSPGDSADGRREARIREIAAGGMIQASAMARVSRASTARSSSSTSGLYHPGDLVDYHRKGGKKDETSWHGPVPVVSDAPSEGNVVIKLNGQDRPYRYQDVRHTLLVLMTLLASDGSLKVVYEHIANMKLGSCETFGLALDRNQSHQSTKASQLHPVVTAALDYIARNHMHIDDCIAVRLAKGVQRLGNYTAAKHCLVVWYFEEARDCKLVEEVPHASSINLKELIGNRFPEACVLQILCTTEGHHHMADAVNRNAAQPIDDPPAEDNPDAQESSPEISERLSTIAEEDGADQELWLIIDRYFDKSCPESNSESLLLAAQAVHRDVSTKADWLADPPWIPAFVSPQYDHFDQNIHVYCHYLAADVDISLYGQPLADDDGNVCIELAYTRGMAKCILDDHLMSDDEVVVCKTYLAGGAKKAVIERDTDLLTPDELVKHRPLAEAAIFEELTIWVKYAVFARHPRHGTQNIMTSRFVAKWKWIVCPNGEKKRIIRMRMAVRGFQDWFAHLEENYSPTAARLSQRLVASETACHTDWIIITIDVEKAFLQGMTFQEIQAETGEPARHVFFSLPPGSAASLRKIPGFETFDERTECLRALKHPTGTKGAPRAFSMKLSRVTRGPCKMLPTTMDPELELRHDDGVLTAMGAKHVDDIKLGGGRDVIHKLIMPPLEKAFGKLAYTEETFTNTGVRHTHKDDGSIVMDQDEYIGALKPIHHHSMIGASPEAPCSDELIALFWSLLGAAAYALITQFWLSVYIVSLQRKIKAPLIIHVRRLNAVVRVAQKRPAHLIYVAMIPLQILECHSDSGFSKEQELGYGIKGAVYLRHGKCRRTGKLVFHLNDSQCGSHKHVTRCSFSAETRAAVIAADNLLPMAMTLHEMRLGCLTATQARSLRDNGTCCITTILTIDSMSLWSAVAAIVVKVPTEKNLAVHLFWLKELLMSRALSVLRWCDTRDMLSDCHTKGSIDRGPILRLMQGHFEFAHAFRDYSGKAKL